jgi:hypothetical protein
VNYSLAMSFDRKPCGTWTVAAEWLPEPVEAETYQEAYWLAIAALKAP